MLQSGSADIVHKLDRLPFAYRDLNIPNLKPAQPIIEPIISSATGAREHKSDDNHFILLPNQAKQQDAHFTDVAIFVCQQRATRATRQVQSLFTPPRSTLRWRPVG